MWRSTYLSRRCDDDFGQVADNDATLRVGLDFQRRCGGLSWLLQEIVDGVAPHVAHRHAHQELAVRVLGDVLEHVACCQLGVVVVVVVWS